MSDDPNPPCQCGHPRDWHRERLYECLAGVIGGEPTSCRCELYIEVGPVVAGPAKAPAPKPKPKRTRAAAVTPAAPRPKRAAKKR